MSSTSVVLIVLLIVGLACPVATSAAEPRKVRNAMWIWAHVEGAYDGMWGLPRSSAITPRHGAQIMGLRNVIMIKYLGKPQPPFDGYAAQFRDMDRLMWSIVGASGETSDTERDHVLELAARMPNLTGVFMDDFFFLQPGDSDNATQTAPAALAVQEITDLRDRLVVGDRRLDLGVTLYTYQLTERIVPHLQHVDVISLWTWEAKDLEHLEQNFARLEELLPGKRILLGIYMWDFGAIKPMPLDLMKKQCEMALRWLHEGRIEGMIFLGTNIMDIDLEAVNWTRAWIAEVGDQPLKR